MVLRSQRLIPALISLALLSTACAKDKKKFGLSSPHKDGQLIVTLKDGVQKSSTSQLFKAYSQSSESLNNRSYLLKFDTGVNIEEMAERLASRTDVVAVEANQIYRLLETTPNDPSFLELWGLKNVGQDNGRAGVDIGAPAAWDFTTGSRDVKVAVIDSGVDYNHPDLKDNIWTNPGETGLDENGVDKSSNGIDDDGNGLIDDWHGYDFYSNDNDPMDEHSHGTHVSGTIGANGDNTEGVVGVNWKVSIIPIKVFSAAGSTSTDVLVRGIEYATNVGAFASNNSWGGGEFSEAIYGAIKQANEKGILFVAAAGNESADNDQGLHYPSNYDSPNIISVAAIDRRDALSAFSNWGSKTVDVAAPGEDIYSTIPGGKYGFKSGTSMATPHVTGALALIRSKFPELPMNEIKDKLLSSTIQTNALAGKVVYGRINVANALEHDITPPSAVVGLDITRAGANSFSIAWNPAGDDGDVGEASNYLIRISNEPILTEEQWAAASTPQIMDLKRDVSGYVASIIKLDYNRSGYVTVRAADNVGNLGGFSESLRFTLAKVEALWSEENEEINEWAGFGTPWAVRTVDGISMVSDSPDGFYANGVDKAVATKELNLGTTELVLELRQRYDLEKEFDYGFIEISLDTGLTWKQVGFVNGTSDWTETSYNLQPFLGNKLAFRLRLRLKSDNSVSFEGWDIDSLKIMGTRPE